MSLFTRARRHVDMNRVKELREEKIKEETIAEVQRQQKNILAELKRIEVKEDPKYSNWRRELTEQMTTVDMGMVNLPGMGDANLADFDFPVTALGSSPGYSQDGNNYTFGPASAGVPPAETASLNIKMNSEKYDTIVFDFVAGTIDHKLLVITGSDGGSNTYELSNTTGRKELRLLPSDRKKSVSIAFNIGRDLGGGLGTNKMLNMSFRRVAPMNLVVGLDDPEANSFIRGGLGGSEERRKQLKDMLEAGNEWMTYNGLEPSKTTPGDIELASHDKPFSKYPAAGGDDKWPGLPQDSIKDYLHPSKDPLLNIPITPFGLPKDFKAQTGGTQVARIYPPDADPGDIQWPRKKNQKVPPGPGYRPSGKPIGPELPKAKKGKKTKTMVAHHEPQYSNWRRDLNEAITMSTAEMGMINLPPNEFDVGAEANKNASTHPTFGADGTLDPSSDYWMMNNAPEEGSSAITISLEIDLSLVDSIDAQIYFTNATIDPAHGMDIVIEGPIGSSISPQIVPVSVPGSGSGSAAPRIVINKDLRIKNAIVSYSVIGNGGGGREIGTDAIQITSTVIYRRAPVNVLVSLDDPDALSFIRGGLGGSKERRERFKDMLDAGNELMQYLGMEPSKTSPGDIDVASDATDPGMGTGDRAALSLAAGLVASPMGQMALAAGAAAVATLLGITIQKAQEVVNQANSMNMSTDYGAGPGRDTVGPLPGRGGTSGGRELTPQQQAEVEAAGNELRDARRALEDLPDDASDEQRIQAQERLGRATKNRQRVRNKHKQENKNRKD